MNRSSGPSLPPLLKGGRAAEAGEGAADGASGNAAPEPAGPGGRRRSRC